MICNRNNPDSIYDNSHSITQSTSAMDHACTNPSDISYSSFALSSSYAHST